MAQVLQLLVFCLVIIGPFLAAAILSGRAEGALFLIYPVAATIPAGLLVFLVFVPAEKLLEVAGLSDLKNPVVPAVGGLAGVLLMLLHARRPRQKPLNLVTRAGGAFVLGAMMGAAWRLSGGIIRYFGWNA
jgi:hypothetical protein